MPVPKLIDLPAETSDISVMADWVEMCALTDANGEVTKSSFTETVRDSGIFDELSIGFADEDTWHDDEEIGVGSAVDTYSSDIWLELKSRAQEFGDAYPFDIDGRLLTLDGVSWRKYPCYTMLLLLDHGRQYRHVVKKVAPDTNGARLFEKICEASFRGFFGGESQRFGWPKEPSWPTSIEDRVEMLAEEIGLVAESLSGHKVFPADKDKGLDVVVQLNFGDSMSGSPWVLFQCACGDNWNSKRGEPALADWQPLIAWDGLLIGGLAVPMRLAGTWDVRRTSRAFNNAIVVERTRLIRGKPDATLDSDTATQVQLWCDEAIKFLPILDPE